MQNYSLTIALRNYRTIALNKVVPRIPFALEVEGVFIWDFGFLIFDWGLETKDRRLETEDRRLETGDWRLFEFWILDLCDSAMAQ